tara:strand:- start:82 stop:921 length:840 start_codon:yes stop_codon:yes gene_type:complete
MDNQHNRMKPMSAFQVHSNWEKSLAQRMERPFPAYTGHEPFIFVCYSHQDKAIVYPELTWLDDQGCHIWYDEGIQPGEDWSDELANAILNSKLLLFFGTPRSAAIEMPAGILEMNVLVSHFSILLHKGAYDEALLSLKAFALLKTEGAEAVAEMLTENWREDVIYPETFAPLLIWAGQRDRGEQILEQVLERVNRGESVELTNIWFAYLGLGDMDQAYDWLERAIKAKDRRSIQALRSNYCDEKLKNCVLFKQDPRYLKAFEMARSMETHTSQFRNPIP